MFNFRKKIIFSFLMTAILFMSSIAYSFDVKLDPEIKDYEKKGNVTGTIIASGSTTVGKLIEAWGNEFKIIYPGAKIEVLTGGSSTAPPALLSEKVNLGLMSRPMNENEITSFKKKFGYEPTEIRVGIDAISVFVNKNNPLNTINIQTLDNIFSETNNCGVKKNIEKWGDLEVKGELSKNKIILLGRTNASATYAYFQEKALCKGRFKKDVNEKLSVEEIVKLVGETPAAIGYSSLGFIVPNVKALALSPKNGDKGVEPSASNVIEGKYPLARFLNIYINKKPNSHVSMLEEEFIKFILSKQGQEIVIKEGFLPLNQKITGNMLYKIKN
jgi:phosphate transport system substrate-binding protein